MDGLNQTIAQRYQIISLIGMGGMADVYKAQDIILGRIVAVKVLRSSLAKDTVAKLRFQREADMASRLSHPNVVDIYDVGEWKGLHYIVMEYIRGKTLKQLLQTRGAFSVNEAVHTMRQLASAIEHAHQHNIIHRDIKPQNVLVKDDGSIKITDFGIAVTQDAVSLTSAKAVMGSAHYLAPEAAEGKPITKQVDIYALGIVFFELLTGEVPFSGTNPTEVAIKHIRQDIRYVRQINAAIPQSVENIVLKATAKSVSERYLSMNQMVNDLAHCLEPQYRHVPRVVIQKPNIESVSVSQGVVKVHTVQPKPAKWPWVLASGILATLCLLIGIAIYLSNLSALMPAVEGMSVSQATQALSSFSKVNKRYVWSKEVEDGQVVGTNFKAGQRINVNEPIQLLISKGQGYLIVDYTGSTLDEVKELFDKAGLSVKIKVSYQQAPNTDEGVILKQSGISSGTRIRLDSQQTIHFVVSQPVSLVLPDLIGQDVDEAKAFLKQKGVAVVISGSGQTVTGMSPEPGESYTQEGTDKVVILYAQ